MKAVLKAAALGLVAAVLASDGSGLRRRYPRRLRPADPGHPLLCRDGGRRRERPPRSSASITSSRGRPRTNAADQLRIFDSFVNQGFNVIAVSPVDVETLKPAIARAKAQGVHVITSDADAPGSARDFYVAQARDQDLGFTILDEMVKRVGEERQDRHHLRRADDPEPQQLDRRDQGARRRPSIPSSRSSPSITPTAPPPAPSSSRPTP